MNQFFEELCAHIQKVHETYPERCNVIIDEDWYLHKINEEAGELTSAYLKCTSRGRQTDTPENLRENMEDELADVFCQTILFARKHKIDIEKAINRKWFKYLENKTE